MRITDFEIKDLVDDVLQDFGPTVKETGVQIKVDVAPALGLLHNDREKIQYTLTNLLDNAIRFTPQGGNVGIEANDRGDELWVAVWDTGVGIPEHEFGHIFRPFYQVEDSLTREHEGMGVGLAIAKGMIELCGGRIWVESEVGQGSRFTFAIPW